METTEKQKQTKEFYLKLQEFLKSAPEGFSTLMIAGTVENDGKSEIGSAAGIMIGSQRNILTYMNKIFTDQPEFLKTLELGVNLHRLKKDPLATLFDLLKNK